MVLLSEPFADVNVDESDGVSRVVVADTPQSVLESVWFPVSDLVVIDAFIERRFADLDRVGAGVGVRVVSLQYLPRKLGRHSHSQYTLV